MAVATRPSEPPEAVETALAAGPAKPRSLLRRGWEVFAENKLALASLAMLVFIVLFCFVGPHHLPHRPGAHQPDQYAVPAQSARTCSAATTSATTSSAG